MRKVFAGLATLLTLAVVAQFYFAASGAFDTAPNDEAFEVHRLLGYGIMLFALLMTILAALARLPGRLIGITGLIAGLALVQGLIRAVADAFGDASGPIVFGLHAVNALIIMALAGTVARQARASQGRTARDQAPVAGSEGTAGPAEARS